MKNKKEYFETNASVQFAVVIVVLLFAAVVDALVCHVW